MVCCPGPIPRESVRFTKAEGKIDSAQIFYHVHLEQGFHLCSRCNCNAVYVTNEARKTSAYILDSHNFQILFHINSNSGFL